MIDIVSDLVGRDSLEALIIRFGGADLARELTVATEARRRLEATLTEEQRALYADAQDAQADADLQREEALSFAMVALGAGIGAALSLQPTLAPDVALRFGANIAGWILAVDEVTDAPGAALAHAVAAAVGQVLVAAGEPGTAPEPSREGGDASQS